jgi:uncharacterized protein (DUF427 family)
MSANSSPGFKKHPDHQIRTTPADARVRVTFKGEVIADTKNAIQMQEATGSGKSTVAPIVYYIPRKDVKMERLVRTAHHSYCPFKGEASYFSLSNGPENAVWSYEKPYDEMSVIREYVAFYPDKVDSISTV